MKLQPQDPVWTSPSGTQFHVLVHGTRFGGTSAVCTLEEAEAKGAMPCQKGCFTSTGEVARPDGYTAFRERVGR